jgi:hypothetical protein
MADIFVSYTSSDRDWAFWVAKELKTLGHVPHVHEWEIKGSDDIYGWMGQHLDAADHVLGVISDDYLKAPYSTLERHAALWRTAKERTGLRPVGGSETLQAAHAERSFPTLRTLWRA